MSATLKNELRELFENNYPGMKVIREKLIAPLWADINAPQKHIEINNQDKAKIKDITIFANQNSEINFVDVELADSVVLKNNRVTINRYITNHIVDIYQSALIFFHYAESKKEWRISYVYKWEGNSDRTNAKRYTYLCGKNMHCRTAAERFANLEKEKGYPASDKLIEAFSVESLTKEFFGQLFTWYSDWACKICKFPSEKCIAANADLTTEKNEINLIRLITRIMFVWFIKQKNLIPSWVFNKEELADILTDADLTSDKKGNYYNAVLQNLFFGALNKKIEERKFADVSTAGIANEQYGIKTYFRDANEGSFFKFAPKDMVEKFLDVPFLNGGLFECLDYDVPHGKDSHKVHYVDGFSREKSRRAFVPNILFWSEDEKQPGLFTILSRYNFTVEESTPNDVQVALDPELLGKIFENLLGTYNPETRESARKESGSFYTPREIVSYMVNSSIKAYLQEKVPEVSEENIEKLTNDDKADDSQIKLTEGQINTIRNALFQIKIIDPACGSGAFPMGILNKLVEIHVLLDKLSARTKSEHNLYIKKGQSVNYNPDESLKINAEYLGNQEFKLFVNGNAEDKIYNSQDLALHVKEIINKYNKELGKKTIANLFSQGRIDDGKSFNSIKTKTDIHQIVDEDTKDIIWQYRSYNVQNKFRQYRNEESIVPVDFADEDNDFEYAKYLYSLKTKIIQDSIFGVDIQPIAVQISKLRFFISLICEQPKIENHPEENYGYNPLPNLETKFVAANTLIGKAKKTDDMALFANPRIDEITKELGEIRKAHFSAKTAQEKKDNREQDEKLRKELSKLLEEEQVYSPEDAKQLAAWNPYDQSAPASSFFDAEWMFGVKDGFDVVIGNPPYKILTKNNTSEYLLARYTGDYKSIKKANSKNIYTIFIENSILKNCADKGILSFIIPEGLYQTRSYADCIEVMIKNGSTTEIVTFEDFVFENAVTGSLIFLYKKNVFDTNTSSFKFDKYYNLSEQEKLDSTIFDKISKDTVSLKDVTTTFKGMAVKDRNTVVFEEKGKNKDVFLLGKNITKWNIKSKYFTTFESLNIVGGTKAKYKHDIYPRILIRRTGDTLCCAYLDEPALTESTLYSCWSTDSLIDTKYIFALLNSTLLDYYNKNLNITNQQGFPQILMTDLQLLPIKKATNEQQQPIIDLVDKILAAKKADPAADTSKEEAEIDRLVYALYGLSEDEIKIVEGR